MTLNEAIDEQFKDLDDSDPVKVRVHCVLTVPTRGGQYSKYFFRDVISFDGEKQFLKLIPHYSCYRGWEISKNVLKPSWIRPDNEFEEFVERPLSRVVDMSLGKMFREIDLTEENSPE